MIEPIDRTLLTLPKLNIEFIDKIEPAPLTHNKEKKPLMHKIQSMVIPPQNMDLDESTHRNEGKVAATYALLHLKFYGPQSKAFDLLAPNEAE